MQFWGLTIDTVNTIILVLAVGLSVDYASHVAHTFMIIAGTRYGRFLTAFHCYCFILSHSVISLILLNEKCLQFDWLKTVVFQLNLK